MGLYQCYTDLRVNSALHQGGIIMKMPIGFISPDDKGKQSDQFTRPQVENNDSTPKMVLVQFPGAGIPLSYYCEDFDLHVGDLVFVEGKYEGRLGRVEKISTNFSVDLDSYKKVVGVADTDVVGSFKPIEGHFITFDRNALPFKKARSWFLPACQDESFIDYDEPGFPLSDPGKWPGKKVEIMDRGLDYFSAGKVVYLSLDKEEGRAIVAGTKPYEVRFKYCDGMISNICCTCPCGFFCKHEVAVLIQLKEILKWFEESNNRDYQRSQYFSIVSVSALYRFAVKFDHDNEFILR